MIFDSLAFARRPNSYWPLFVYSDAMNGFKYERLVLKF